jgi:purine-nucleoside/S-methyl-5'-thioadenosine phosphorylase / adenosine deaminase
VSGLAWDEGGDLPLMRWTAAPAGVTVAFTSREGGVSGGPFRSLNLGALTADDPANVAENRRRAVAAAGGEGAAATMAWQVHGADVREVDERPAPGRFLEPGAEAFPKSDGLATGLPERPLVLLTADCLPIAIAREDGRRLAVLHAGWRGLVAGIVERGAEAVRGRASAAVGPGAGPCCYEVGEDVAGILCDRFGDDVVRHGRADLWLAARRALEGVGVTAVEVAGECSICGERFFSHRRDRGTTGRQGIVGVLGA